MPRSPIHFLSRHPLASLWLSVVAAAIVSAGAGSDDPPAAAPLTTTAPAAASVVTTTDPNVIDPALVEALKGLKAPAEPQRKEIYKLLEEKGDAKLIPALKAFSAGTLILRDGKLLTYGTPVEQPDKSKRYPVLDALTGQPLAGPDGKSVMDVKLDLGSAFRKPLTSSARDSVNKLVATLSLLSPDRETRLASIRDAGERASRVFPDLADAKRYVAELARCRTALATKLAAAPQAPSAASVQSAISAIDAAQSEKPAGLTDPLPSTAVTGKIAASLKAARAALASVDSSTTTAPATTRPAAAVDPTADIVGVALNATNAYQSNLTDRLQKLEELPRYGAALQRQLDNKAPEPFLTALREAKGSIDVAIGDREAKKTALPLLGSIGTSRAENILGKTVAASERIGDQELLNLARPAYGRAASYQGKIKLVKHTFDGLSSGSILVLLALGLSIIFGLMGVINMAHGEFMMVGAFTTLVVSEWFKVHAPGWFDYYPIIAIPAAFLVSGVVGLVVEGLIVRHLYGRPLDTLLATWGVGLVLIWFVRKNFGDTVSVTPPRWMIGAVEVLPDLSLGLNRLFIIVYCGICVAFVYWIVNWTKLGLLLRATTQNREMAAALGVKTRRVDALTFAVGTGLAGLAGVVVPMYDKINPGMGGDYVIESFMVVVVGGVGKLAGAIFAGLGLGFIKQYLEPLLQYVPSMESGASVLTQVIILGLIVAFLQKRPSGLFPPKGRLADA